MKSTTASSELQETLLKPARERLDYFRRRRIGHPTLMHLKDQLFGTIGLRAGVDLAIVTGPTGVGKSTLNSVLKDQVERGQIEQLQADPGRIPLVLVEAPSPETAVFGWKDFYVRILEALDEPLIDKKLAAEGPNPLPKVSLRHPSLSAQELRRVAEKCLRYRRTAVLVVDEAQHMFRAGSGRRLMDCLEVLKSFASQATVFVVLVGTYDLTTALDLNGQLGRRTAVFNFPHYPREAGFQGFLVALKGFQERLPVTIPADLLSQADYLYEASLGLVGVLKNHLERALAAALREGANTVTPDHLQATALDPRVRLEIIREIRRGEDYFTSGEDAEKEARQLLGLEPANAPLPQASSLKRPHKPGERKPRRDPVGAEMEAA